MYINNLSRKLVHFSLSQVLVALGYWVQSPTDSQMNDYNQNSFGFGSQSRTDDQAKSLILLHKISTLFGQQYTNFPVFSK